jgi:hypothetical protein
MADPTNVFDDSVMMSDEDNPNVVIESRVFSVPQSPFSQNKRSLEKTPVKSQGNNFSSSPRPSPLHKRVCYENDPPNSPVPTYDLSDLPDSDQVTDQLDTEPIVTDSSDSDDDLFLPRTRTNVSDHSDAPGFPGDPPLWAPRAISFDEAEEGSSSST